MEDPPPYRRVRRCFEVVSRKKLSWVYAAIQYNLDLAAAAADYVYLRRL